MKSLSVQLLLALLLSVACPAADLLASGNWTVSIGARELLAGTGSDLPAKFESTPGVTMLTIRRSPGRWSLHARLAEGANRGNVAIHVRRISSGSGRGVVTGGSAYVQLSGQDTELFTGTQDRACICLQYKLTGLTRTTRPATYLSSIIFTVD